jgi:Protein of unknown function (DUF2752)
VRSVWDKVGLTRRIVRSAALGAFGGYVAWNAVWISKGEIPPSILHAVIGLPCPTTGGIRSVQALCQGELLQALRFNPLMLVYLFLLGYSVVVLAGQMIRGQRLVLKPFMGWLWYGSLVVGWVAKFVLGRRFW